MQEQPHEPPASAHGAPASPLAPAAVLITQAEYARRCGVSREAVRKMVERGMPMHEQLDGRKLIDQAEADLWRGVNVAQLLLVEEDDDDDAPAASEPARPGLTAAKTETERHRSRLIELQLNQQLGKLRPVEDITVATQLCAEALLRALGRIRSRSDELFARAQKDGLFGVRACLREIERDLRKAASDEFARLAAGEMPEADASDDGADA